MITLYKRFKYDNSYTYIKTFSSKIEQDNYFNTLEKMVIVDDEYVKEYDSFNIGVNYDELIMENVNYLKFNNGFKDIYAFIIHKEYLNDEVTRLHYEVDVIQTFMFDFTIEKSFVERKNCTMNEITDFDEGIELGEHIIENDFTVFNKNSTWFAMFNGIKEQQLVFNNGIVTDVLNIPFYTSKPLTLIDGIQYPLFFMPLRETYQAPIVYDLNPPSDGVIISARKLLGKPYVWGGNYPPLGTDKGTDCSGLIQWAFNDSKTPCTLAGRWTTYSMIENATWLKDISLAKVGDVIFSRFNPIDSPSNGGYPEHVVLISEVLSNGKFRIIEAQQEGVPILERIITFDTKTMELRRMN